MELAVDFDEVKAILDKSEHNLKALADDMGRVLSTGGDLVGELNGAPSVSRELLSLLDRRAEDFKGAHKRSQVGIDACRDALDDFARHEDLLTDLAEQVIAALNLYSRGPI